MSVATDEQVQNFVNKRIRPRAEQIRSVLLAMEDDKSLIGDIYENLTQQSPTWSDNRQDGPPHLLSGSDVLSYNTFMTDIISAIRNHPQFPVFVEACESPL